MIIQGIRYASDFEAKKLMIQTGHDLDEKGYTLSQDGSMSVRVGPNAVWVTKGGSENGALSQGDFVRVDLNGKSMNHSPDAVLPEDLEVHLKIYRENAQIQGIIHAYPVCAVLLQEGGRGLEACDYTPAVRTLGKITLVPSGDLAQITAAAALAAKSDKGVLIEGDGCLMWGASVAEAYRNIRLMDYCAQVKSMSAGCSRSAHAGGNAACVSSSTAPENEDVSAFGIPGLTGLYHPAAGTYMPPSGSMAGRGSGTSPGGLAGCAGGASPGTFAGSAAAAGIYMPPSGSPAGGAMQDTGIPGLTQIFRPGSFPTGNAVLASDAIQGSMQGNMTKTNAAAPAPPDPVRDSAMAEVIRKSMIKMGKGGL